MEGDGELDPYVASYLKFSFHLRDETHEAIFLPKPASISTSFFAPHALKTYCIAARP
jgi:hypothetical protein